MSISFYDASVGAYLQVLDSVANIMDKGANFCAEEGSIALEDVVTARLREDMMPFHFQIESVAHHSLGAINGMRSGRFTPPSFAQDKNYTGLQGLISQAQEGLRALSEDEVNALADGRLIFALGERELPFTNENFLLKNSLLSG